MKRINNTISFCWFVLVVLMGLNQVHQAEAKDKRPHLILLLADDFGWGNIGFHRTDSTKEVQTPNMDALAAGGVILDRFYAYKICSPTRSSLQSGRNPLHVNTVNVAPEVFNPKDPVSGYAGIPRNMTCIAQKLKSAGYQTAMTGKWDAGMATPRHTPRGRGYDRFLGYFHHANDYNTCGLPITAVGEIDVCRNRYLDLWKDDGPAYGLPGTAYEEELFEKHTLDIIANYDASRGPLFLFHSFHIVHTPLQVPEETLKLFSFIDYMNRRKYAAMVYYMDRTIGRIVKLLQDKDMYDDSIILFFSDNGGPIYNPGSASNYGLKGGKYSDWEGGVRVNAFAAGGRIPESRRGTVSKSFVHVSDVYASFIRFAHFGTDNDVSASDLAKLVKDEEAEEVGLPAVDSQDTLWAAINGDTTKRTEIHLSSQALISGKYKLVIGDQMMSMWQGPQYPNKTGPQPPFYDVDVTKEFNFDCGPAGCLFDIFADPSEYEDLALKLPQLRKQLLDRLTELNKSEFQPNRGKPDPRACEIARKRWKGFYGPFLNLPKPKPGEEEDNSQDSPQDIVRIDSSIQVDVM